MSWLRSYFRETLRADVLAGLTVGVMLVPQAMAYAMLAGLPPVIGLYASVLPLIAYALIGTSQQLAVGPVAIVSLLVLSGVSPLAERGSAEFVAAAALLALLVGAIQIVSGALRLGFLANYLSHSVISGFTSAAAIIIILSQLKHLLGIDVESGHSVLDTATAILTGIGSPHPATLLMGTCAVAFLLVMRWRFPRWPAPLLLVVATTVVVWALRLEQLGVAVVGDVPRGLPHIALPSAPLELLSDLGRPALTIVLVGFMESIAIARLIAARENSRIDADRELLGLGAANALAAFVGAYPVTGGLSRTAINYQAGARTRIAGVITAALVMLTVLLLTPLFAHLPKAALAAVVIVAVSGLVSPGEARHLFRIKRADGWTFVVTFAATLVFGPETGILTGVAYSIAMFIRRSSHPHIAELGCTVDTRGEWRDIERFPAARCILDAVVLRIDGSLYFANMEFVAEHIRQRTRGRVGPRWVVLVMSGVNDMDAEAVLTTGRLLEEYSHSGVRFAFAETRAHIRDLMERADWYGHHGEVVSHETVEHIVAELGLELDTG